MPNDEETRRLIENRKRNAEYRKEQQMKKRKMTLAGLGGIIVLLVIIIIFAASCSSRKDQEVSTTPMKETTILGAVTQAETTETQSVAADVESTSDDESTSAEAVQNESTAQNESTTSTGDGTIKYTNDTVNVRRKANQDSTIIEVLEKNEKVVVLGTEGKWTHVKWGDIEGYISSEFLKD